MSTMTFIFVRTSELATAKALQWRLYIIIITGLCLESPLRSFWPLQHAKPTQCGLDTSQVFQRIATLLAANEQTSLMGSGFILDIGSTIEAANACDCAGFP